VSCGGSGSLLCTGGEDRREKTLGVSSIGQIKGRGGVLGARLGDIQDADDAAQELE